MNPNILNGIIINTEKKYYNQTEKVSNKFGPNVKYSRNFIFKK